MTQNIKGYARVTPPNLNDSVTYHVSGSTCLTTTLAGEIRTETGESSAVDGDVMFSSLQRKQMMSTMETLPMHWQGLMRDWSEMWWWLQVQRLIWVSSVDLRAVRASRMVAEMESDFKGGLPRQRSATICDSKRDAI